MPRIPRFRDLTNTHGIDWRALKYATWCTDDGYMQQTARALESVGLNATDGTYSGKAAILRAGEAVDAIDNAIDSAEAATNFEAGGKLLCSITQMGGILYVTLVLTVVLVGLTLFPCINCLGRFAYDLLCFSASAATQQSRREQRVAKGKEIRVVKQGPSRIPIARLDDRVPTTVAGAAEADASSMATLNRDYLKKDSSDEEEREGLFCISHGT